MENKKAQGTFGIFQFIIVAFLIVVFFGGLIYVMGMITDVMHNAGLQNEVNAGNPGYTNMTIAADETFGQINNSIQSLRMVALVMILGLGVSIIITNALMRISKFWFFAYLLIVLLAVIFAPMISNAYLSIRESNIYGGILESFTGSNYILQNLPTITAIVGLLGGIFLFIQLIREPSEQNLYER